MQPQLPFQHDYIQQQLVLLLVQELLLLLVLLQLLFQLAQKLLVLLQLLLQPAHLDQQALYNGERPRCKVPEPLRVLVPLYNGIVREPNLVLLLLLVKLLLLLLQLLNLLLLLLQLLLLGPAPAAPGRVAGGLHF